MEIAKANGLKFHSWINEYVHAIQMVLPTTITGTSNQRPEPAWIARARSLAGDYIKSWREAGYAPTKQDAALYVEGVFSTDGIYGGRDCVLDRAYIERHALTGITGKRPGEKSKKPKVPDPQRGKLPNLK